MTGPPPEMTALIMKIGTCYVNLTSAVKSNNREKALDAATDAALITMNFATIKPFIDSLGVKVMTPEEASQFKKDLHALLLQ